MKNFEGKCLSRKQCHLCTIFPQICTFLHYSPHLVIKHVKKL